MIDFYYWPTPNGWKVSIALEEMGLDYTTHYLNIGKGEQFAPEFLALNPNHRMPVIVDHAAGPEPVSVFESGAILWHLAHRTGQYLPSDTTLQKEVLEWLFWQTGNQGPMMGQHSHFRNYAPDDEKSGYAKDRYEAESVRCLQVMERRLEGREWLVGEDYSIADMMCFPWVLITRAMELPLEDYPRVADWRDRIKERPAVQRGVALGKENRRSAPPDEKERKILFQQGRAKV